MEPPGFRGYQSLSRCLVTIAFIHIIYILQSMNKGDHTDPTGTAIEIAVSLLGGKWKLIILDHLSGSTRRFNELRRLMPRITQRMLTLQLRELEADGLLSRKVYPQVPPKVEYSLTTHGKTLAPVLAALGEWGATQASSLDLARATPPRSTAPPPETAIPEQEPVATDTPEVLPPAKPPPQPKPVSRVGRPWGSTGSADVT